LIERDLHKVAERIHRRANVDMTVGNRPLAVDIEGVAESLDLHLAGSGRQELVRLPVGKGAHIRLDIGLIVIRRDVFNNPSKDLQRRGAVAHEVAHALVHGDLARQRLLPLTNAECNLGNTSVLSFSRSRTYHLERAAIYLGALLLVPFERLLLVLAPTIENYALGRWASMPVWSNDEEESRAAMIYAKDAVQVVSRMFCVEPHTAKIALDYWQASSRPPQIWLKRIVEARRTSLH